MCLMAAFCTASAEQILPRDSVQRNCFKLALYTTRDHDCISNRIGSGIRTCPRCGCRLATFGALPTPSTIYREIIMLNNHRFWGHASGPSSSSDKTLSSFHCWHGHAAAPYRASGFVHCFNCGQYSTISGARSGFCAAIAQLAVENLRDSAIRAVSWTAALCCTANSGL